MAELLVDTRMQQRIHSNLLRREVDQHTYIGASPFTSKRPEFVDWIRVVAEKFRLRDTSSASAIAYLDQAMDYYAARINFFDLQVLAMACLMVGAKMEEQEPDIPLLTQVIKTAGLSCTVDQLGAAELQVLKAWDWNVCVVTPNHFVELYSRESALDDMVTGRAQAFEHIDRISEYATEAARTAWRDKAMLQFRPSVLATASVICARTVLKVEPHLPPSLMAISGWGQHTATEASVDLGTCCKMLLRLCSSVDSIPALSPLAAHAKEMEGIAKSLFPDLRDGDPIQWPLAKLSLNEPEATVFKADGTSTSTTATAAAVAKGGGAAPTTAEQEAVGAVGAQLLQAGTDKKSGLVTVMPMMTW